jgi:hypothetical protein
MLGYTCLAHAQSGFEVAYARFLYPDHQQDLDAGGLADQGQDFGDLFFWMA